MKSIKICAGLLSLALLASGCDLLDMPKKMDAANAGVDATNDKLGRVDERTYKQTLLVALDDMYKEKNTENMNPVPFGMLKGGKTFAETANESDLVDWFYAEYKNLKDLTADEEKKIAVPVLLPKFNESGKKVLEVQYKTEVRDGVTYKVPKEKWVYTKAYIAEFNHKKDITFNAMQVVAAFIPQSMIEYMVSKEIGSGEFHKNSGDLREHTVYMILNLRDAFTRGALLKNSLYEDKLKNMEQVKEAHRLVKNLNYIASLGFDDRLAMTEIRGYLSMSENYVYAMQTLPEELASVDEVRVSSDPNAAFKPQQLPYISKNGINNPSQKYYVKNNDGLTVTSLDIGAVRAQAIAYNSKVITEDWTELQNHFHDDLPPNAQDTSEAQEMLSKFMNHN